MAKGVDVKIDSRLDHITSNLEKDIVKGLTTAAIRVHGDAVKNAEASVVTGRLRASITYAVDGSNPRGHSKVGDSKPSDSKLSADDMEAIIGTNVEYAQKVERTSRSPGYMRRAYEGNRKQIRKDIESAVKKAVN